MKKLLLAAATAALIAPGALADSFKFVFDGQNDMYGLTRYMTDKVDADSYVKEWSFNENGIDFLLTNDEESTGNGFSLVYAISEKDPGNAGIMVASYTGVNISLTVPGGNITGAKLWLSGYTMNTLEVDFNGTMIEDPGNDDALWTWQWADPEAGETLVIKWPKTYLNRFIHAIEITYNRDLGGKKECGLAFPVESAEGVMGEEFAAPVLENPNNLPIVWTSSDEAVATVDAEGKVSFVSHGKTVITASTEGNNEFGPGSVKYDLTVIPVARNIAEMKALAPNVYDRVKVLFPMTVTFGNLGYAFVIDSENNATCINDYRNEGSTSTSTQTIYTRGDIIPAGWMATNATIYSSWIWRGLPENVTEKVEDLPYPEVEAITPADADRVLILKNVTFTTSTAKEMTKAYGTTPDGKRYEFQDTYDAPLMDPGCYNVTGVVRYSVVGETTYFYMAPLAYTESTWTPDDAVETIEADGTTATYFNLQGAPVANPANGIFIRVANGRSSKVIVR